MSFTATLSALPAPLTTVIPTEEVIAEVPGVDGQMTARRTLPGHDVLYAIRTNTRWDVGGWTGEARLPPWPTFFLPPRMWVFATTEGLLLAAWLAHFRSPQPLARMISFADINTATYNHQIGQLCLTLHQGEAVPGLKMEPLAGLQFLANIEAAAAGSGSSTEEDNHA